MRAHASIANPNASSLPDRIRRVLVPVFPLDAHGARLPSVLVQQRARVCGVMAARRFWTSHCGDGHCGASSHRCLPGVVAHSRVLSGTNLGAHVIEESKRLRGIYDRTLALLRHGAGEAFAWCVTTPANCFVTS
jgi:hypothetical protein